MVECICGYTSFSSFTYLQHSQILRMDPEVSDASDNEAGISTISVIHRQRIEHLERQQAQEAAAAATEPAPTPEVQADHGEELPPLATPPSSFVLPSPHTQNDNPPLPSTTTLVNPRESFTFALMGEVPTFEEYLRVCAAWKGASRPVSEPGTSSRANDKNHQHALTSAQTPCQSTTEAVRSSHFAQPTFGVPYECPVLNNRNHASTAA